MRNIIIPICASNSLICEKIARILKKNATDRDQIFLIYHIDDPVSVVVDFVSFSIPVLVQERSILSFLRSSMAYIVDKSCAQETIVVDIEQEIGHVFHDLNQLARSCLVDKVESFEQILQINDTNRILKL